MSERSLVERDAKLPPLFIRPPKLSWKKNIKFLFWNPNAQTCCTRTPRNWAAITLYYIVFLTVILLLLTLSLFIVETVGTTSLNHPRYTLNYSFIGSSPGLTKFPSMLEFTPLVWVGKGSLQVDYVKAVNKKLKPYKEDSESRVPCNPQEKRDTSYPCDFDLTQLGDCGVPPYGFNKKEPCFFFSLTQLINWKPDVYTDTDSLPAEMPQDVQNLVKGAAKIWLSCRGTSPRDKDLLTTSNFKYLPSQGFEPMYFPYLRQQGFVSPLVAVKMTGVDPSIQSLLGITCTLWDKNIKSGTSAEVLLYIE